MTTCAAGCAGGASTRSAGPGIDGGKTATLDPSELDDEYFMLRIRSDGGALSGEQLRAIAGVSQDFARNTADITDRQNIQLHWIRIEDVPAIWERLEAVGLMTTEACGDTPRVILGSPVAGIAADEIIDGTPALEEIRDRYIGAPEFSNLPRKFKTAISGSPSLDVAHETNDVSFVGVVHPEFGPGFDVWVGGGLSTNPMFAQRLGAWVSLEEIPEVWVGVVSIFRDYGYRRLRNRARLKFLVADWGAEKFREVLEKEYLGRALLDGPAPALPPDHRRDHVGVHPQVDGRNWVGVSPVAGRVSGDVLARGRRAGRHPRLRPGPPHHPAEAARPRRARRAGRRPRGRAGRGRHVQPARPSSAAACWPAPASSSASWPSSRPRPAPARSSRSWSAACPSWTARWPSTSTAARTRAPGSRSPTSASRASS